MPQSSKLKKPPETMTWIKASPFLVVAGVFDIMRFVFNLFWFFGPAIAALYCTVKGSGVAAVVGTKFVSFLCVGVAVVVGFYGAPAIATLGIILAMATGLLGWFILGLSIKLKNPRLLSENSSNFLWFAGSLLISEIPIIGVLPAFTTTMFKLFSAQIRTEAAILKKYEEDHAAEIKRGQQERQHRAAQILQARNIQISQIEAQQEAANDEQMQEEEENQNERMEQEAANDDEYIPQDFKKTA